MVCKAASSARGASAAASCSRGAGFARYLTSVPATDQVIASYVEAHRVRPGLVSRTGFERIHVRLAAQGVSAARVCDAYGRFFQPRGLLRRKLVVETVDTCRRWVLTLRLFARLAGSLLALVAGVTLLVPLHALAALGERVFKSWPR